MGASRAQGALLRRECLHSDESYKRLERGKFRVPRVDDQATSIELDALELSMLLDGIDVHTVRRPPLWEPQGGPHDRAA